MNIKDVNRIARAVAVQQGWNIYDPKLMHKLIRNLEAGKEIHAMPTRKKNPVSSRTGKRFDVTQEQWNALQEYANHYGRNWKSNLLRDWETGRNPNPYLQQVRNNLGPTWLVNLRGISTRKKNPTKAQLKSAAKKIASVAGRTAWRGTKFAGRVAGSSARAAASEVKRSICKNPATVYKEFPVQMGTSITNLKTVWIARTAQDAIHVAKVYAKAYPNNIVRVP